MDIYINMISGPCRKVLYAAELLDIDYTKHDIDFQHPFRKTPEYREVHPAGKLPGLVDGDFKLFESGAICKYLCRQVDSSLFPQEIREQAIMFQWEDFVVQHVGLALGKVAFNRVIAPKYGIEPDQKSLNDGLKWLNRYLPILDDRLRQFEYLCGEELTLADVSLLAGLDRVETFDVDLSPYPNLSAWLEALRGRNLLGGL